ncbi:GNAT family N-acetyltransferase [Isoptericola sp. 4D.3]|uniref:GNAT family N-acetyltransferase n=1 Tax=Isoptericola peretonis TaxID=2918523 RepID=A0ABT0J1E6_9MICO|nr:GNAT family N-acetyltransferase [Isoptericola sp. 4D.3]
MGVLSARGPEIVLETERLRLRPWRVAEALVHRTLWTERDPRVPAHRRIDADGRPTLEDVEGWIRDGSRAGSLGLLATELKATGEVVGYCGLIDGALGPDEPELAFELLRRTWGAGYATEAAGAVVGWARESGHARLWATVRDWNVASRRVLAKVGLVETARVEPDHVHGDVLFMTRGL